MKNKLTNLNDHLFAQMERLSDETTKGEKLQEELSRAKAISSIAKDIIGNARLVLDAEIAKQEHQLGKNMPELLGTSNAEK